MARYGHTATLLGAGHVLVAGGYVRGDAVILPNPSEYPGAPPRARVNGPSSELYDPVARAWVPTGEMVTPRAAHTATQLGDGQVLVAGGSDPETGRQLASAELYEPRHRSWIPARGMREARAEHTTSLLDDGTALAVGGYRLGAGFLSSAERYVSRTDTWLPAASMSRDVSLESANLLLDGGVLVVGCCYRGSGADSMEAEVFRDQERRR
jgi:hypothetical protein